MNIFKMFSSFKGFYIQSKNLQSVEEKSIELNVEANRLKTFDDWPLTFIDKHLLALQGFYFLKDSHGLVSAVFVKYRNRSMGTK